MMHRITGLSAACLTVAIGCGSTVSGGGGGGGAGAGGSTTSTTATWTTTVTGTTTTTTTATTTTTTTTGTSAQPPAPGVHVPPDGAGSAAFAIRRIFLGDTDRDGTPNPANGWKQYGFDLDHDISTVASTNLCKPQNNAPPKNVYPDGNDGIDNSFGKNILPILLGLASDFSGLQNEAIDQGQGTWLFDLVNLGSGADYGPLFSRFYAAADLGAAPHWDGTDPWPVRSDCLASPPTLSSAKLQVADSYTVGNTWVARASGQLMITLAGAGIGITIPIHNPTFVMDLDPGHLSATQGTIAGVIPTAAFQSALVQAAAQVDPSFCDPSNATIQSIINQVGQASDILVDGTQDPSKPCDGISIGIGFDAARVGLGTVTTVAPLPDPCQ